jgi:hypothetical protein
MGTLLLVIFSLIGWSIIYINKAIKKYKHGKNKQ